MPKEPILSWNYTLHTSIAPVIIWKLMNLMKKLIFARTFPTTAVLFMSFSLFYFFCFITNSWLLQIKVISSSHTTWSNTLFMQNTLIDCNIVKNVKDLIKDKEKKNYYFFVDYSLLLWDQILCDIIQYGRPNYDLRCKQFDKWFSKIFFFFLNVLL